MLSAKDVFDNPLQYIDFLRSADFEGQYSALKIQSLIPSYEIRNLSSGCVS